MQYKHSILYHLFRRDTTGRDKKILQVLQLAGFRKLVLKSIPDSYQDISRI
jgi:hypothetical protein